MALIHITPLLFLVLVWLFKVCSSTVHIRGPTYVETGERINLTCSTDHSPPESIADFLINNKSYTSLLKTADGCFNTVLRAKCDSITCGCSDDGKIYYLQLDGLSIKGVNSIVCLMRFHSMEKVDHLKVYVVDVHGPNLTIDEEQPLKAGADVTLTCSVQTDLEEFEFNLNCSNITWITKTPINSTRYIIRIQLRADIGHHGKVCSCRFFKDGIMKTDTLVLYIINYPLIKVQENQSCNGTGDIQIICQGLRELTGFGFSYWTHTLNGTFIRKLQGDSKDEMSVLRIPHCTYKDVGDYLCSAFNTYEQERFWSNKTTSVSYLGLPIVISAKTYKTSVTTFSVQYISQPMPKEEEWYLFDELLNRSPGFIIRSAKGPIHFEIYGREILTEGYLANLTITMNNSGVYTVVLQNDLGIAKHQFISKTAGSTFTMNSVILVLAVGIVFIITAVVTVVFMNQRHRQSFLPRTEHGTQGGSIYYAAPPPESSDNIQAYDLIGPRYEGTREYEHSRRYDVIEPYYDETVERKDDINDEEGNIHIYFEIQ